LRQNRLARGGAAVAVRQAPNPTQGAKNLVTISAMSTLQNPTPSRSSGGALPPRLLAPAGTRAAYREPAGRVPDYAGLPDLPDPLLAGDGQGSGPAIKLIVWDLDDTLWEGTLADGGEVRINQWRRDFILRANQHGLINSVVSKNDPAVARAKLQKFGLLDALIHPIIAFRPKGALVKGLVQALHLREQNTLFVDDNPLNLNEVKFFCPRIQTLDARHEATDRLLAGLLARARPDRGKRHREYQVLAQKLVAAEAFGGDNEAFLRQCAIKVALVRGTKNLRFASRIEELVNRSNQMNFLKTRIPKGTATFLIGDSSQYDTYSVFVRDRYGSYGLVGFAAMEITTMKLIHFAFSCRIMNMGVESIVLAQIAGRYGASQRIGQLRNTDYITVSDASSPDFQLDMEIAAGKRNPDILVMANCQSGIIAHYLGATGRTDAEQWPEIFTLAVHAERAADYSAGYQTLIYGIFNEYNSDYWPQGFTLAQFYGTLDCSLFAWSQGGAKVYVIMPPDSNAAAIAAEDRTLCTFAELNRIVRDRVAAYPQACLVPIASFVQEPGDISRDQRHYSRTLLRRVADKAVQRCRMG
jgi:FkbH-like protein